MPDEPQLAAGEYGDSEWQFRQSEIAAKGQDETAV
jgi:hypothetical protein